VGPATNWKHEAREEVEEETAERHSFILKQFSSHPMRGRGGR